MINCFGCGKKKEDYEEEWNKITTYNTYDSELQNNDIIHNMSDKSMMCHACIKMIEKKLKRKVNNNS